MIAYYATLQENAGWGTAWRALDLATEVETMRGTPLRALVFGNLPPLLGDQLILDAGCGLGAWVALFAERGYRVMGVDAVAPTGGPLHLCQARLEHLWMLKNGEVSVYLSLGVIEHEMLGPHAILREAVRVLAFGGTALVSVPYVNGLRWFLAPWIALRQIIKRDRGAAFYQYAYTKRELVRALARHGLIVQATHPYGPTKMFRTWFSEKTRDAYDAGAPSRAGCQPLWRRTLRRLLYTRPMLRLCGHMLLAVAVKR
jgi:SAM-dependent methyltransferase